MSAESLALYRRVDDTSQTIKARKSLPQPVLLAALFGLATLLQAPAHGQGRATAEVDTKALSTESKACKMPAPFTRVDGSVSYQGKPVGGRKALDPRYGYRPIDFDGDGSCEVLAETCGPATGVRNSEGLMYPEAWLVPLKFKGGLWTTAKDIGG